MLIIIMMMMAMVVVGGGVDVDREQKNAIHWGYFEKRDSISMIITN